MNIFTKPQLAFEPIDPLGDGLREAIEAERRESEAIRLQDDNLGDTLLHAWDEIVRDVEHDPDWFHFADSAE